ncbi:hypothetical protein [Zwartia sp.]|uniref:hypothetical protein n=1 Tax=Zwartia sp. TaxID=2978004 RepID=UPI0027199340|nr:hypothetical protein [Zwartia sp.]MDO9024721.1 hypothetical protein [Zwartia sp.]
MEWVITIGVMIVAWFLISHHLGKPNFWKLTRQHPQEAWRFFNSQPEWHIDTKPQGLKVTGPFRVVNPYTNEFVKVYCNADEIEQSEEKFMRLFKAG